MYMPATMVFTASQLDFVGITQNVSLLSAMSVTFWQCTRCQVSNACNTMTIQLKYPLKQVETLQDSVQCSNKQTMNFVSP